jgi:DNA recombination protein RmuC
MESYLFLGLIFLLNLVIFFILIRQSARQQNTDSNTVTAQILAGLNQSQLELITKISDQLNAGSREQSNALHSKFIDLNNLWGEANLKLNQSLNLEMTKMQDMQSKSQQDIRSNFQEQAQEQKLEFEKMQNRNLVSLNQLKESLSEQLSKAIKDLVEHNRLNFEALSKNNQEKLGLIQTEVEKRLDENLAHNLKSFKEVTINLTSIQGTAQKMIESTSSIDKLNSIFERTSSKAFGDFGEKYLESMLAQYLHPESWSKQVTLAGSSQKVDFVLKIDEKNIGIDCKFPVTVYHDYIEALPENKKTAGRAFLSRIENEAKEISKYYQTESLDLLLLYLPSDGMYAEVVSQPKTIEILQKLKITPASPSTIFPIILLLKEYQFKHNINENAEDIIKGLTHIKKNVESFKSEFRKLGDKIRQAQTNYETADKNLSIVQSTVERLEDKADKNSEPLQISFEEETSNLF